MVTILVTRWSYDFYDVSFKSKKLKDYLLQLTSEVYFFAKEVLHDEIIEFVGSWAH